MTAQTTKYLVTNTRIEVNAVNANGFTALDILAQSHRDIKDFDISESLRKVGALRTIDDAPPQANGTAPHGHRNHQPQAAQNHLVKDMKQPPAEDWLTRKRDSLMVVASLIATMAFQSGLNPPGGLWQEDDLTNNNTTSNASHLAGKSIMADKKPDDYAYFLYSNTIGFVASLSIILLLVTGLPFKKRIFMWLLTVIVWVTITAMALTYRISIIHFTPSHQVTVATRIVNHGVTVWCGMMAVILLLHFANLVIKFDKMVDKIVGEKR